jgi:hypothetical protein
MSATTIKAASIADFGSYSHPTSRST